MKRRTNREGSTLFVTVLTLAFLSVAAAVALQRIAPQLRIAYQNAAWQEARLAAESGVDSAMHTLILNGTGTKSPNWTGWKQVQPDGTIGPVLTTAFDLVSDVLALVVGPPPPAVAGPIFLDNVQVSPGGDFPAEVDVQVWALRPGSLVRKPWFRIRSMATCALPRVAYQAPLSLDVGLRRFSLRTVRQRLRDDDVGTPRTIPLPNVSRAIEVLAEPITPFEMALWCQESMSLAASGTWLVDSYDSRDPNKSNPDGTYPGPTSAKVQEHGGIGTNLGRPFSSPYGTLIAANRARVRGVVGTNGGDDPQTSQRENVDLPSGLTSSRIRDDFDRTMQPILRPTVALPLLPPLLGLPFVAGTEASPTCYYVAGHQDGFRVTPPAAGGKGRIVMLIDGDLDLSTNGIVIPPDVTAQLFVRGDVNFRGFAANSGSGSSNRPAQLQIYAEGSGTDRRRLRAQDSAVICAAFYGPMYDARIDGSVTWNGAIAARSLDIPYGGNGGIHYDEALAFIGPPVSYRIVRYVEDVRE